MAVTAAEQPLGKKRKTREGGVAGTRVAEEKAVRKAKRKAARKADRKAEKKAIAVPTKTIEDFLTLHEIKIHEKNAPPPCIALASAPFPPELVRRLLAQPGFTIPSPVQAASWPLAVAGRDVLAIAKTGSGKTLGFLLPALARCAREKAAARGRPICLVMAPTRELALQIAAQCAKFADSVGCRAVAVYGGAKREAQVRALQRGCELVVATPGRMMDILDLRGGYGKNACTSLKACSLLVLDEADRMVDIGFEQDIRTIAQAMPEAHQTLLYSATWPEYGSEIRNVASDLMNDMIKVTVGTGGEKLTANQSVTQRIHVLDGASKFAKFQNLTQSFAPGGRDHGKRVIVFSNTKADVKWITKQCKSSGFAVDSISGDRSQSQRESTIRRFRAGTVTMVIATDVAARGLDIDGIERVINYDFPGPDDYIHRIGRTGRAGAKGAADTLFTDADQVHAKELIRILTDAGQIVPKELAKYSTRRMTFD